MTKSYRNPLQESPPFWTTVFGGAPIFFLVLVSNNRVCLCFYNFRWGCGPWRMCACFASYSLSFFLLRDVCSLYALRWCFAPQCPNAFFFERALGLYVTALRAVRQTLAFVLWMGGLYLPLTEKGFVLLGTFPGTCDPSRECHIFCVEEFTFLMKVLNFPRNIKLRRLRDDVICVTQKSNERTMFWVRNQEEEIWTKEKVKVSAIILFTIKFPKYHRSPPPSTHTKLKFRFVVRSIACIKLFFCTFQKSKIGQKNWKLFQKN